MSRTTGWFLLVGLCILIQVASVYAFNPDLDPSLVGCWKLDETSGTIAIDSSGHGNNGAIHGNPTWVPGKLGGALNFDGTGDYVDCGNAPIFTFNDAITVSAWVNIRTVAVAWQAVVAKGENAWRISSNNLTQTFHFGITYWTNANYSANGAVTVGLNEWHHVTGTFDGKDIKLWVDGVVDTTTTGNTTGIGTSTTNLLIGENPEATGRYMNGLIDDVRIFHRALSKEEIAVIISGVWDPVAESPNPAKDAVDVPRETDLSWKPGPYAQTHDVYFGTSFDDVNSASRSAPGTVLISQGQDANSYDLPGRLEFGTTYYWRVDEVNAAPSTTIVRGTVWSFTTEPLAYKVPAVTATASSQGPTSLAVSSINGSGLVGDEHGTDPQTMWLSASTGLPAWIQYDFDQVYKMYEMWVWNHNTPFESMLGFGAKDAVVEYSSDGTTWTKLGDFEFAQAPGEEGLAPTSTVSFGGVPVKSVRITISSSWMQVKQTGLSEVRFLYIPVSARQPTPATGSTGIDPTTVAFSWRAGREAVSHNIYVGTDADAVQAGTTPTGTSSTTRYTPSGLQLSTNYYWRVDEVNTAEVFSTWAGPVWSFSTPDFVMVDDFEAYTDETPSRIFDAWLDGYGTTTNGAMVGNAEAPFAEQTAVHSGKQSMPMMYNNAGSFTLSEATLTFANAKDWTAAGIKTLVLFFRGKSGNTAGQLYVKINNTKITYPGDASIMTKSIWKQWNIDLTALSGLKAVNSLTIGITGTGSGTLYFDDIRLYAAAPVAPVPADPGTTGLLAYYMFSNNLQDSSGNGNNGTAVGAPTYTAGLSLSDMALRLNGATDCVNLGNKAVFNPAGSFSVSLWANIGAWSSGWNHVMIGNRGEDNVGWQLRRHSSASFCFTTRGVGNDNQASVATPPQNEWVHFTCVYDNVANTKTIYINGTVDSVVTTTAGAKIAATTHNTYIGARALADNTGPDTASFFTGMLDEIRLFGRALTAGEALYLAGDR
jgi:hypothetical protein